MKILRTISFVLMALGVLLFLVGILSKIQHWPDILKGQISGLIVIFIGIVIFLVSLKKRQKEI